MKFRVRVSVRVRVKIYYGVLFSLLLICDDVYGMFDSRNNQKKGAK